MTYLRSSVLAQAGIAAAFAAFMVGAGPAIAASGSSGGSSSGSGHVVTCKSGRVYDSTKKKCVPRTSAVSPTRIFTTRAERLPLAEIMGMPSISCSWSRTTRIRWS